MRKELVRGGEIQATGAQEYRPLAAGIILCSRLFQSFFQPLRMRLVEDREGELHGAVYADCLNTLLRLRCQLPTTWRMRGAFRGGRQAAAGVEHGSPLTERIFLLYSFRGSKCGRRSVFCDYRELEEPGKPWFPNTGHSGRVNAPEWTRVEQTLSYPLRLPLVCVSGEFNGEPGSVQKRGHASGVFFPRVV